MADPTTSTSSTSSTSSSTSSTSTTITTTTTVMDKPAIKAFNKPPSLWAVKEPKPKIDVRRR